MKNRKFLGSVQGFIANSLSISTVRRMGPSGTLEATRTFLKNIDLSALSKTPPASYERYLDKLTVQLQGSMPPPAHWGVARKCLNLFFRDALYNFYLRNEFHLADFERYLEIPLDSHVGRQLAETVEGLNLPRWQTVVGLDRQLSAQYQKVAAKVAKREATHRVHLDVAYWRNQSINRTPKR